MAMLGSHDLRFRMLNVSQGDFSVAACEKWVAPIKWVIRFEQVMLHILVNIHENSMFSET